MANDTPDHSTLFMPTKPVAPAPMPRAVTSGDASTPPPPAPLVDPAVAGVRVLTAAANGSKPQIVTASADDVEAARTKAREMRAKSKSFELEVPIVIGGTVYQNLILRRPRWVALEKALATVAVQKGQASENLAMISAVSGVPIQALADPELGLDLMDGMRLMKEIQDFFPQALQDKPQLTSEPSSATSPNDGAGAALN
jgi:hypothetical protein